MKMMSKVTSNHVERYKLFLEREGLAQEFERELRESRCISCDEFYDGIIKGRDHEVSALVTGAFIWFVSKRGHKFWEGVEEKWNESEKEYLESVN